MHGLLLLDRHENTFRDERKTASAPLDSGVPISRISRQGKGLAQGNEVPDGGSGLGVVEPGRAAGIDRLPVLGRGAGHAHIPVCWPAGADEAWAAPFQGQSRTPSSLAFSTIARPEKACRLIDSPRPRVRPERAAPGPRA